MAKTNRKEELINAYFLPETFAVDSNEEGLLFFENNKYETLFHMAFSDKGENFSPSFSYLHNIAELLIKKISQQSDIEFTRENLEIKLSKEELNKLKEELPFAIGMEYVDENWINLLWNRLLMVFKNEISLYDGTVKRYFADYNSNINVVGRVFFHLVENDDKNYPFAFMATYSTKEVSSKRAVHTPLKNALSEFNGDEKKLLQLISAVIKASDRSELISNLLESGELFSPLKFTAEEAYTFLKEILIYEEAGIMCRVPDWWKRKSNSVKISISIGEKEPSKVGLEGLMDFSPSLLLGDEKLSEQELKEFMELAEDF